MRPRLRRALGPLNYRAAGSARVYRHLLAMRRPKVGDRRFDIVYAGRARLYLDVSSVVASF